MPYTGGSEEEQCRKLFIGGISLDTTDEALNDYFAEWGNITDCVVIKDGTTGRSKGFGFVTYEKEEEADACMARRPHNLLGRQIDVKRAVSREESMKPGAHVQVKKIFIGGISPECTEERLREYFQQFGDIDSCEIPHDRENNKPRGFGFVTFSDFDTVDKLVSKRVHEFSGMRCEVKKALSKQEMEKAKTQVDMKSSQRYGGRGGKPFGGGGSRGGAPRSGRGRGGGGSSGAYGRGGGDNRYAGDDSYSYGDYDDYGGGYEGYGGRGGSSYGRGGSGYGRGGSNYGRGGSNYGPMRNQSGYRGNGPYGGGYGSGNSYGGYGNGGGGGYENNSGYGGYSNW